MLGKNGEFYNMGKKDDIHDHADYLWKTSYSNSNDKPSSLLKDEQFARYRINTNAIRVVSFDKNEVGLEIYHKQPTTNQLNTIKQMEIGGKSINFEIFKGGEGKGGGDYGEGYRELTKMLSKVKFSK